MFLLHLNHLSFQEEHTLPRYSRKGQTFLLQIFFFQLNVFNVRANTQLIFFLISSGYLEERLQTVQNQFPSNNTLSGKDKSWLHVLICNYNRLKHGLLTLLFTLGYSTYSGDNKKVCALFQSHCMQEVEYG